MTLIAISYGGGVESTSLLVLAARGELGDPMPLVLFADVGRAENPATIAYVDEVARPFCERHGIAFEVVQKRRRTGETVDLWDEAVKPSRTIPVPMRMANGAPGNRTCTFDFKIRPIAKALKERGATKEAPADLLLGIGVHEYQRMTTSRIPWIRHSYPLIDRRLDRADAESLIRGAGLPIPEKSSCIWCPFKKIRDYKAMLIHQPEQFEAAADFEAAINAKRDALERDHVWLTSRAIPLREAITDDGQTSMFDGATCDVAGYCFA